MFRLYYYGLGCGLYAAIALSLQDEWRSVGVVLIAVLLLVAATSLWLEARS
jgi:hypothetical protein